MLNNDNDLKKDNKEPAEGTFKGYAEDKSDLENSTDSDLYAKAACKEDDTNILVPDDDSVEEARNWVDENKK